MGGYEKNKPKNTRLVACRNVASRIVLHAITSPTHSSENWTIVQKSPANRKKHLTSHAKEDDSVAIWKSEFLHQ